MKFLLQLAALAPALSTAFLIPEPINIGTVTPVSSAEIVDPLKAFIRLPCPSCPKVRWSKDGETALLFKFEAGQAHLTVNDNSIVPFDPAKIMKAWHVSDKNSQKLDSYHLNKAQKLDLAYDIYVAEEASPDGFSHSVATLKVNTINGVPAKGLDTVQIRFVTSVQTGEIYIVSTKVKHFEHNVGLDGEDTLCKSLVCKVREAVSKKLNKMKEAAKESKIFKGCSGKPFGWWRRPSSAPAPEEGTFSALPHYESRPHHGHHHGGRPHRFHDDKDWKMIHHRPHHDGFFVTASQILLPVVIGITAGIMVSLVAVLFMQIAIFAYRRIRGQREEADEETGKGLLEEDEEEYTDAPPVYEETGDAAVGEKQ